MKETFKPAGAESPTMADACPEPRTMGFFTPVVAALVCAHCTLAALGVLGLAGLATLPVVAGVGLDRVFIGVAAFGLFGWWLWAGARDVPRGHR